MKVKKLSKLSAEEKNEILNRGMANLKGVLHQVSRIIAGVKNRGDKALIEYTEKFDRVKLNSFKVTDMEIKNAKREISDDLADSLKVLKENLIKYHRPQLPKDYQLEEEGVILGRKTVPLEAVGCYVPKGYPSSLLMAAVPARLSQVSRIVIVTPPGENGHISPALLYAAHIAEVDEVYKVGGAQAIAALTLGTETIKPVPKIVGPGNIYVTAAKKLLRDEEKIDIDFLAGPSEIAILIHDLKPTTLKRVKKFVVGDILAQLEHGSGTQAILLCDAVDLAREVAATINENGEFEEEIEILTYQHLDSALQFINDYGPEHLEIIGKDGKDILSQVRNAGSVFLGEFSPVAIGDYCSGTNHILPTMGMAKFCSGLGIEHFIKGISYQELTKDGLNRLSRLAIKLAQAEGMQRHARSIEIRFS